LLFVLFFYKRIFTKRVCVTYTINNTILLQFVVIKACDKIDLLFRLESANYVLAHPRNSLLIVFSEELFDKTSNSEASTANPRVTLHSNVAPFLQKHVHSRECLGKRYPVLGCIFEFQGC
jgi:hypothetical protein